VQCEQNNNFLKRAQYLGNQRMAPIN